MFSTTTRYCSASNCQLCRKAHQSGHAPFRALMPLQYCQLLYSIYFDDMLKMKSSTYDVPEVFTQKRQLEATFTEHSQKRFCENDNNFFGLPPRVKHMFKKHKRITELYGACYLLFLNFSRETCNTYNQWPIYRGRIRVIY